MCLYLYHITEKTMVKELEFYDFVEADFPISELRKCKATGQVVPVIQIDVERSCPYYLPFKN